MSCHGAWMFGCCVAMLAAAMAPAWAGDEPASTALCEKSIVSAGDSARVEAALAKARRGDKIVVGVIGGSITAGAKATSPTKNYGALVAKWWRDTFPKATVEFVNAGIGATGSNYGALRASRDLLSHHPDFVIVEYSVNDPNNEEAAETLEGLVRQILTQPQQPAVMLLFMMSQGGNNAQEWHSKVGSFYHLPMISYRDAFWPQIKAGNMKWDDVEADEVHPNDRGHAAAALFITHYLDGVLKNLPADDQLPAIQGLPAPMISDQFQHVKLLEAGDLKPVSNTGWTYDAAQQCWKSSVPGSVVEFDIAGQTLLMMEYHLRSDMGMAKVQVDGGAAQTVDSWFSGTWGGWRCTHDVARNLAPGTHRVRIELLDQKNPESTGNEFRLLGLGAAGITP